MLGTFILGILAAVLAPHAEPHVKRGIESVLMAEQKLDSVELRQVAFAVCLLLAAALAWLLDDGSALALAFGAAVGVFGPRLIDRMKLGRDG